MATMLFWLASWVSVTHFSPLAFCKSHIVVQWQLAQQLLLDTRRLDLYEVFMKLVRPSA